MCGCHVCYFHRNNTITPDYHKTLNALLKEYGETPTKAIKDGSQEESDTESEAEGGAASSSPAARKKTPKKTPAKKKKAAPKKTTPKTKTTPAQENEDEHDPLNFDDDDNDNGDGNDGGGHEETKRNPPPASQSSVSVVRTVDQIKSYSADDYEIRFKTLTRDQLPNVRTELEALGGHNFLEECGLRHWKIQGEGDIIYHGDEPEFWEEMFPTGNALAKDDPVRIYMLYRTGAANNTPPDAILVATKTTKGHVNVEILCKRRNAGNNATGLLLLRTFITNTLKEMVSKNGGANNRYQHPGVNKSIIIESADYADGADENFSRYNTKKAQETRLKTYFNTFKAALELANEATGVEFEIDAQTFGAGDDVRYVDTQQVVLQYKPYKVKGRKNETRPKFSLKFKARE